MLSPSRDLLRRSRPVSPSVTTTSSLLTPSTASSFDALSHHLSLSNFRQAYAETRRLLIHLAGQPAQNHGYVFFSEVQFISTSDLQTIDHLWRLHNNNRFGYIVQRSLWERSHHDFTRFFIKIGWMKMVESEEVEQYNYCAFPDEFVWEVQDDGTTPEGHLTLTNTLRGTQLLESILMHPPFGDGGEEERDGEDEIRGKEEEEKGKSGVVGSNMRSLKTNYSF